MRRSVGTGRFVGLTVLALLGGWALAPAAGATITSSQITSPGDPTYVINDEDAVSSTIAVSGTTNSTAPGTDRVDLDCFYGASNYGWVALNVPLNPDGSFSDPTADVSSAARTTCRLRAVPAGTVPSDLSPFSGPVLAIGERATSRISGGPNNEIPFDFYIDDLQLSAAADYDSVGSCGLDDGYLLDSTFEQTTITFYCNAWLWWYDDFVGGGSGSTRSEIQVDGANAYLPATAKRINSAGTPGFPPLSYSFSQDPSNGNLTIHETDPIVVCPDPSFPPSSIKCSSFASAGVRDDRTIIQDHDGHLVRITDEFVSTDGAAHSLDLLWQNDQRFNAGTGSGPNVAYRFPGEGSFSTHAAGDSVSLPATAPASTFIDSLGAAEGDLETGRGAITYDRAPSAATFNGVHPVDSDFYFHDTAEVPAGGSTGFRFAYSQAYTEAEVAALAGYAEDSFSPPTVTISKPKGGSTSHNARLKVAGTAADNVGIASLTVGGHAVTPAAGGGFSTHVLLHNGANAITAVAADAAGNTTQAQVRVKYPRLRVSRLKPKKTTLGRVLASGFLEVRLGVNDAARVKLSAALKGAKKAFKKASVRFGGRGKKTVKLKLTGAGRRALGRRRSAKVAVRAKAVDAAHHKARKKAGAILKR